MVSMLDVARLAHVSKATVSNTLNRPWLVLPATRDRVQAAIGELGFVPDQNARRLSGAASKIIGLLVLDATNPFFTEVTHAIESVVGAAGYLVILCNSDGSPDKESHYLELLAGQRVAGVVMSPTDRLSLDGMPFVIPEIVYLDHNAASQCSATVDNVHGGELAIRHLIDVGAREVCFVGESDSTRQHADRWIGAQRYLTQARSGVELRRLDTVGYDIRAGVAAGEQLLSENAGGRALPDAIMCANDLLAFGVYRALARQGIDVPGQVQLIGYDDIEFSADWIVPLTTVRQPTEALGRAAATMVLEHVAAPPQAQAASSTSPGQGAIVGGHEHRCVVLQPELVVRQSTRRA